MKEVFIDRILDESYLIDSEDGKSRPLNLWQWLPTESSKYSLEWINLEEKGSNFGINDVEDDLNEFY